MTNEGKGHRDDDVSLFHCGNPRPFEDHLNPYHFERPLLFEIKYWNVRSD